MESFVRLFCFSFVLFCFSIFDLPWFLDAPLPSTRERLGGFVFIRESVCNPRHFNKLTHVFNQLTPAPLLKREGQGSGRWRVSFVYFAFHSFCFAFQFSTYPDSLMLLSRVLGRGWEGLFLSGKAFVIPDILTNSLMFSTNSPLPLSWKERGKAVEDGEFRSFILLFIRYASHFFDSSRFLKLSFLSKKGAEGEFY